MTLHAGGMSVKHSAGGMIPLEHLIQKFWTLRSSGGSVGDEEAFPYVQHIAHEFFRHLFIDAY